MATILICVMAATAIAPCAVGSETDTSLVVTRHPPGAPSTDMVYVEWTPSSNGAMYLNIKNAGLASVTIQIIDIDQSETLLQETVRFQGDGSAERVSQSVSVIEGNLHRIYGTPGGPPDQFATLTVCFEPTISSEITYTIYDMFEEPWDEWWNIRASGGWDTERVLTNDAGEVSYLYSVARNPSGDETDQGLIYAPYRWNVGAVSIPNLNVHDPVFMPKVGSTSLEGAESSMEVYFQYLYSEGGDWTDLWIPEWGETGDYVGGTIEGDASNAEEWASAVEDNILFYNDGYMMGTLYEITMNRLAAEEWIGLPRGDDPVDWWADESSEYIADWDAWIDGQGNEVYDIYCGYEFFYTGYGTMMALSVVGDDVVLRIGHISQGYEALMTRWLKATDVSMHQPYMEDFTMTVDYREGEVDLDLDAVAQWGLHCVKQNATDVGVDAPCAWAWEPIALDYVAAFGGHPSDYTPYYDMEYTSWNCGDVQLGGEVAYEGTPVQMDLAVGMKLVVVLPDELVLGYHAENVPADAVLQVWEGNQGDYDDLMYYGDMSLGYMILNGNGYSYDPETKTLTIEGLADFENPHPDDGDLLYHGAPWLEFNVDPVA